MSMLNRPVDGTNLGETVMSVRDYEKAQKAVSSLIEAEVPARDITIVGVGVRTVEKITGRLGYATAARSGAINGVFLGLLMASVLVLGNPEAPMSLFVGFLLVGVAVGMLMSLAMYAIVRRRRDFASVTQLAAESYELKVLPASLARAREILGVQRPAPTRAPVNLNEPPRYGERIPQGSDPASLAQHPAAAPAAPAAQAAPQFGERIDPATGDHAVPADLASAPEETDGSGAPPRA